MLMAAGAPDITVEPDLQPIYPTTSQVAHLLSPNVGLAPVQKAELVSHCLTRSCVFGDLTLLTFLLTDSQAQSYVDLAKRDEDGLGLISVTILGFGSETDRDIEREECVRLLIFEGCDVTLGDNAGWTALHYAALLAPPTLVSHLLTHGSAPLCQTRRGLTALDIVTAHSVVPGREDVALLLEEAMRESGWTGGRMEEHRRSFEQRTRRIGKRKNVQDNIVKILGINATWWGDVESETSFDNVEDEDEDETSEDIVYTPPSGFAHMLVFSQVALPDILQSLITDYHPTLRDAEPAKALYMLARFACLHCDHNWIEDLIIGATDAIEETFFNRAEDATCLIFWLYNTTIWMHLMRCDDDIKDILEELGSFALIEEILNSVFVFIIRFAERKIDTLLDAALLDFSPLSGDESIQFESEWSFLRSFGPKKKTPNGHVPPSAAAALRNGTPPSPKTPSRPPSPSIPASMSPPKSGSFASLRQTFSRARATSSAAPLQALFADSSQTPTSSPADITSFMTALHTLLNLSGINPALTVQLWSQVMYWTACESFNRILTRKKYLCRSRALQIGVNLGVLEEWIGKMDLPRGIGAHFAPVRDLLNWLQCLSSITEFSNLIATMQTMRNLNPLQMRRAVRDYKYEVNEGRMTDECNQYLAQLQKDWERHRIKLGVEALRKEIGERDQERDREDGPSVSPSLHEDSMSMDSVVSAPSQEVSSAQRGIDSLFDRAQEKSLWEPVKASEPLGELLDSRHMLPLVLPSDPRMLGALPAQRHFSEDDKRHRVNVSIDNSSRSASRASFGTRGAMAWRHDGKRLREVGMSTLQCVDGTGSARWNRVVEFDEPEGEEEVPPPYSPDGPQLDMPGAEYDPNVRHLAPLTRKPSTRSRGRASVAGDAGDDTLPTPVERPQNPAPPFAV